MTELNTDSTVQPDGEPETNQVATEEVTQDASTVDESEATQNQPTKPPARKQRLYSQKDVNRMLAQNLERERRRARKDEYQSGENQSNTAYGDSQGSGGSSDDIVKQVQRQLQEQQFQQDLARRQAAYHKKVQAAAAKYEDFEDVLGSGVAGSLSSDAVSTLMNATEHMDKPGEFIYELCLNHPEKLEKFESLGNPWAQAKYIGQLEAELTPKVNAVTGAPAPIQQERKTVDGAYKSGNMTPEERHRQRIKKLRERQ